MRLQNLEPFIMHTLRIIGAGIKGIDHFTYEAIAHCKNTKQILLLGTIDGINRFFLENNLFFEDISAYYENGALDSDNYRKIKAKVLDELKTHHDVVLIVLGHPRLGVTIVQEFQQEKLRHNFQLHVMPGISSFDTMINDLAMDPLEEGTAILDANRLILYDYHMDPCLNYFIYHVCSVGNSYTDYEAPEANNATQFLKQKLLKHFPYGHKVFLVTSTGTNNDTSTILQGTLHQIEQLFKNVTFASSLFIPAILPKKSQINQEFYQHMMNHVL